jgi:hypothetical protein
MFDFLTDQDLREKVESKFHAASYIYRLGEALAATDEKYTLILSSRLSSTPEYMRPSLCTYYGRFTPMIQPLRL